MTDGLQLTTLCNHHFDEVTREQVNECQAEQHKSEVDPELLIVKHQLEEVGQVISGVEREHGAEDGQKDEGDEEGNVGVERFSIGSAFGEDRGQDQVLEGGDNEDDGRLPAMNNLFFFHREQIDRGVPGHRFQVQVRSNLNREYLIFKKC